MHRACTQRFPLRTVWGHTNAKAHCRCVLSLGAAVREEDCCGAPGLTKYCAGELQCGYLNNCNGNPEATNCREHCKKMCSQNVDVWENQLNPACRKDCLSSNATCTRYQIC